MLKFLLKHRIIVAAVVNATVFGLLRERMNMWLAALVAASLYGAITTLPVYWDDKLRKSRTSDTDFTAK